MHPDQTPIAIGERVLLRSPHESDRDAYVRLRQRSRDHLERWEPIPPDGSDAFSPMVFDRELALSSTDRERRWLIVEQSSRAIVGRVALGNIERGPFQNGRFGYWIGKGFEGKGYMFEALSLAITHAFKPEPEGGLGLHRVCANVMPINERSKRLLERIGFTKEGYSENYLQIAGNWEDHERWAMTKPDG